MPEKLYEVMARHFSISELKLLCMTLGVEYEELEGENTRSSKASALIAYMQRVERYADLLAAVHEERSFLDLSRHERAAAATPQSVAAAPRAPAMRYANFDIRLRAGPIAGQYSVEVSESPSGESRPILQPFPLDEPDFRQQLAGLQTLTAQPQACEQLGRRLWALLFPPEVWTLFRSSQARVQAASKGLRLRLRVEPPELSRLPWEYCYDDTLHYLALNRETPLVRYIEEPFAAEPLEVPRCMRVVVAIASPLDAPPLDVEAEAQRIQSALAPLGQRVELKILRHATVQAVQAALVGGTHVFHFVGHGVATAGGQGALAFEGPEGETALVDADTLRVLFQGRGVKLAVLNACQSAMPAEGEAIMGVAPALVRAQIPAVVAMQFPVPDQTALAFTSSLYRFLADGQPLDTALTEMRIAAYAGGSDKLDWGIPVLFMRAPDGMLWQRAESAPQGADARPSVEPVATSRAPVAPTTQSIGIHFAGPITGQNQINISGNVAGGDLVIHPTPPTASAPTDVGTLVAEIRQGFDALRGQLGTGDAEDGEEALSSAETLLGRVPREPKRIARQLDALADVLAGAVATVPAAALLLARVVRARQSLTGLAE